jgi:hypothetical protein
MEVVEPRIVERLPGHRERILRACFRDAAIAELCRDYDALLEAIEVERPDPDPGAHQDRRKHELLDLACDLEKELLDRLDLLEAPRQARI